VSIIVSEEGENARKLEPTSIALEDYLQTYIKNNPHTIPIDEIEEDLRLLILAREFPTESGPIDAIGIDQNGSIYIIETKLAKNPDKRRVLAQALDYGAALWRSHENTDEFIAKLEQSVAKSFKTTLSEKVEDFFGNEVEDVTKLLQTIRQNLSAGDFRFVVLMDQIEDRLKNLITFVNRNSQFTIYGVEMEFYKFDKYEVLIPKLYGAEVTKEVSTPKVNGSKQQWDESSFFAKAKEQLNASIVENMQRLYQLSMKCGQVSWNSNQTGSFGTKFAQLNSRRSFCTLFTNGVLELNLGWHGEGEAAGAANRLREELRRLPNLDNGQNFQQQHVSLRAEDWSPQVDAITNLIQRIACQNVDDANL
jgi:hypothetical protein